MIVRDATLMEDGQGWTTRLQDRGFYFLIASNHDYNTALKWPDKGGYVVKGEIVIGVNKRCLVGQKGSLLDEVTWTAQLFPKFVAGQHSSLLQLDKHTRIFEIIEQIIPNG